MNQERAGAELARTTLGSSSRDGDRSNRDQRRTRSSSGFLVDSPFLPRSVNIRSSYNHPRPSGSDRRGKRGTSEVDAAPKKRSRFPWGRQKESPKDTDTASEEVTAEKEAPGSSRLRQDTTTIPESGNEDAGTRSEIFAESQATASLDRDSLQIVNLALNLSESRRRGNVGLAPSPRIPGDRWTSSAETQTPAAGSIRSRGSYPGRDVSQTLSDYRVKSMRAPGMRLSANEVSDLLPQSATSDSLPHGFSAGTLVRAANARRHFELFYEYLRLLPSLPPLSSHVSYSTGPSGYSDGRDPPHRVYNPLQSIRNRKVRFRERCPIDIEGDGWNDIDKVHNWVNLVETRYTRQPRSSVECLKLPPFERRQQGAPPSDGVDHADAFAVSPPSSLRRVSRTSSLKARRPMSDWVIYPDELLADAAWAEEAQNKSKVVDRDGNVLYADPSLLVVSDALREQVQADAQPSSHTSLSDARRSLSVDLDNSGRGRQSQRFGTPGRIGRSSSASGKQPSSKRHKLKLRSRSPSSSSNTDDRQYRTPLQSHTLAPRKSMSPLRRKEATWDEKRGSLSSVPSGDDPYDPLSLVATESRTAHTPVGIGYFPSIASNLSAPSSRSPSPHKRGLSRAIGSKRAQSRSSFHRKAVEDDSSSDSEAVRKDSVTGDPEPVSQPGTEPIASSGKISGSYQENQTRPSFHERKESGPQESKLRGIFRGPGKIAGKVGNEVSKMGDFILRKDNLVPSRKSSIATSDGSELDEEDAKTDKRAIPRAILRRLSTFGDDIGRPSPRSSDKSLAKNISLSPPAIAANHPLDGEDDGRKASNTSITQGRLLDLQGDKSGDMQGTDASGHAGLHYGKLTMPCGTQPLEFGPELYTIQEQIRKGRIRDSSVPFNLARPPVTGLAQAQPTATSPTEDKRPTMTGKTSAWSISDRSMSIMIESGVPGKQEVEHTRALLLSSGIKAREIARRAESARNPPPEFLQRAFGTDTSIPCVPRLYEHELASQKLLKRIEACHHTFQSSIEQVPKVAFSPLKSQLSKLEDLVNESLNPRVQVAAQEAETLSVQLSTTSTLAVKQLSETLDRGIRKRHRRLRWLRRTGFVMLEWAMIGLMWWVWLIVVAFKLLRRLLLGFVSGARWVLWL